MIQNNLSDIFSMKTRANNIDFNDTICFAFSNILFCSKVLLLKYSASLKPKILSQNLILKILCFLIFYLHILSNTFT